MRKPKLFASATAVAALALAASANAGPIPAYPDFENQYEGRAQQPGFTTYVGFDVKKKKGVRRVTKVKTNLVYSCLGAPGGQAPVVGKGGIKVKPNGKFTGSVSARIPATSGQPPFPLGPGSKINLSGKLNKGKIVKGRITSNIRVPLVAPPRGGIQHLQCTSGNRAYKVKRGADLPPIPAPFRALGTD